MVSLRSENLSDLFERIIWVLDLGRGLASKVIESVGTNKERFIVVKNNKPQAVIVSVQEYLELIKAKEDLSESKTLLLNTKIEK